MYKASRRVFPLVFSVLSGYSSSSWIADCTFVKVHVHAGGMLYPLMDILSLEKSFRRFWNCDKIIDNESLPLPYERIRRILHGD